MTTEFAALRSDGSASGTRIDHAAAETRDTAGITVNTLRDALRGASNSLAGVRVTPDTALTFISVFAAVNVISRDVSCLPPEVYRRLPDGGRVPERKQAGRDLICVTPDGLTTAKRWRQAQMGHALTWGNGYAEIERLRDGRPAALHLLAPSMTRPVRSIRTKQVYYDLGAGKTLPPDDVIHVAGLGFDGLSGYSPVQLCRDAIGLGKAAELFGSAFFGNGSTPKGILTTPGKLSDTAYKRLGSDWDAKHQGLLNSNKTAILEEGLSWQSITMPLEDAQFLATRQFQRIEVAAMYNLPPHKLGDYSQSHLANLEASNLDYLTTSLMPWLEEIEQVLNMRLLTKQERADGYYVEHNMAAFLRGDMKARGEFFRLMRDLGALSPNEIRVKENLNPIEGGDIYLVPLNLISLDQAGQNPKAIGTDGKQAGIGTGA